MSFSTNTLHELFTGGSTVRRIRLLLKLLMFIATGAYMFSILVPESVLPFSDLKYLNISGGIYYQILFGLIFSLFLSSVQFSKQEN